MSNYNFFLGKNKCVGVCVFGDFEFFGNFADAVTEYLYDADNAMKYIRSTEFPERAKLAGISGLFPLAEMEQVMVALWDTVPRLGFNKNYRDMLRQVGIVMAYFRSGDLELYETAIDEVEPSVHTSPTDILKKWLTLLQTTLSSNDYELDEDDIDEVNEDDVPVSEDGEFEHVSASAVRELWHEVE